MANIKKVEVDVSQLQSLNPQEAATLVAVDGVTPNRIETLLVRDKDGDEVILMTKKS